MGTVPKTDLELIEMTYMDENDNGFIRKVYSLFTFQALVSLMFLVAKLYNPAINKW